MGIGGDDVVMGGKKSDILCSISFFMSIPMSENSNRATAKHIIMTFRSGSFMNAFFIIRHYIRLIQNKII